MGLYRVSYGKFSFKERHIEDIRWKDGSGQTLTHQDRDKIAAIFQTTFSHAFSWKCIDFDWDFNVVCPQWSNQEYSSIGSDNDLALSRRQAIIWTNDGYFTDAYMRHSASTSQ